MEPKKVQENTDYNRHSLKKDIHSMDIKSNKSVKGIQKRLNKFLSTENPNAMRHFKLGYHPYEDKDSLKVDGMYGSQTKLRIKKFLDLNEALTTDSVFSKLKEDRLEYLEEKDKYWKGEKNQ